MKRIITTIFIACVAAFFTQCKKEIINQPNGIISNETVEVSLNVDNSGSKTDIDGLEVSWNIGDRLHVVGSTNGYLGYISAQNEGVSAYFTGVINKLTAASQTLHFYYIGDESKEFTLDANGNYIFDISVQDGTLDGIGNKSHLMYGSISGVTAGTTNFGTVEMESMISIVKLKFTKSTGNLATNLACYGAITTDTIDAKNGVFTPGMPDVIDLNNVLLKSGSTSESNDYFMALIPSPLNPSDPEDKKQKLIFANEKHSDVYLTTDKMSKEVLRNKFYTSNGSVSGDAVSVTIDKEIQGALPGRFSIGVDSKGAKRYTYFSKGNVNYVGSPGTWRFQDNQYDYTCVGAYSFAWSTTASGCNYGMSNTTTIFTGEFLDWGNNSFVNGGNAPNLWCTFSKEEIDYLFYKRENHGNLYGHANYSPKPMNGLILLPDNWVKPDGVTFTSGNSAWANVYDSEKWTIMESAGAVFFPAGGYVSPPSTSGNYNIVGYYYSRTYTDSPVKNWDLYFESNNIIAPNGFSSRHDRLGVRLIYKGIGVD